MATGDDGSDDNNAVAIDGEDGNRGQHGCKSCNNDGRSGHNLALTFMQLHPLLPNEKRTSTPNH